MMEDLRHSMEPAAYKGVQPGCTRKDFLASGPGTVSGCAATPEELYEECRLKVGPAEGRRVGWRQLYIVSCADSGFSCW